MSVLGSSVLETDEDEPVAVADRAEEVAAAAPVVVTEIPQAEPAAGNQVMAG